MLFVKLPQAPVMVTVKLPVAVAPLAERVNTLLEVAGFAPKVPLTPFGKPEAVKMTLLVRPFRGLIETVVEPEVPCRIVTLEGEAKRRKLGWVVDEGQLLTKLAAFMVPMPVAKSQPTAVP